MVKVQVRVDDRNTPQYSRMAYLAGVSPPLTEEELKELELNRAGKSGTSGELASRKKSRTLHEEGHLSKLQAEQGLRTIYSKE